MDTKPMVNLTEEKETLLITLYAKAVDSRSKYSILQDRTADSLVSRIDYDFSRFNNYANDNIIVIRARQFDDWLLEYLAQHSDAIVINLGCGLDTRIDRIHPSSQVNWYDIDFPDVIQLRRKFYADNPGYKMVASSIVSFDWLKQIPAHRPTIIIAEGVLEYLTEPAVQSLLNSLTDHFQYGQIIFDVMSQFAIHSGKAKLQSRTGASHQWAVDALEKVDQLNPKLERINTLSIFQSPHISKFPFRFRIIYRLMSIFPVFRNMLRLLRYKF